jgi:CheY-like chemotaxis protein
MDGFELLDWVRRNETWRYLPVIVVTGSSQSEDLSRALDLGANTYVVKDLLMRPPPNLFEAIQRYATPATIDPRRVWAHKAKKLAS